MRVTSGSDWRAKVRGERSDAGGSNLPKVATQSEFYKLKSCTVYIGKDGNRSTKPRYNVIA